MKKNLISKLVKKKINSKFYEIVRDKNLLKKFEELRKFKDNKSKENIKNPKKLAIIFIRKFNICIKKKEKNNNKIYFVRHKKTKYKKNVFLGQKINPSIIDNKETTEFKNIKFNKFISSPSKRCLETTRIFSRKSNIIINKNLKEIDYGIAENLTINDLKKKFPEIIKSWSKKKDPKFPNGENTQDVLSRINKFLKYLKIINSKYSKKNILVLTHNVVLRCLLGSCFNIKLHKWFNINVNYFELLEFIYEKNEIRTNINRNKFLNLFNKFYFKYK